MIVDEFIKRIVELGLWAGGFDHTLRVIYSGPIPTSYDQESLPFGVTHALTMYGPGHNDLEPGGFMFGVFNPKNGLNTIFKYDPSDGQVHFMQNQTVPPAQSIFGACLSNAFIWKLGIKTHNHNMPISKLLKLVSEGDDPSASG